LTGRFVQSERIGSVKGERGFRVRADSVDDGQTTTGRPEAGVAHWHDMQHPSPWNSVGPETALGQAVVYCTRCHLQVYTTPNIALRPPVGDWTIHCHVHQEGFFNFIPVTRHRASGTADVTA
jgi:hypothetical protein